MKFFKKHKWLSFAVISFIGLSGVNFYIIFELVRVIRRIVLKKGPGIFFRKKIPGPFFKNMLYIEKSLWYTGTSKM